MLSQSLRRYFHHYLQLHNARYVALHNLLRGRTPAEVTQLHAMSPFNNSANAYTRDAATLDDGDDAPGFRLPGEASAHERFRVLLEEYLAPPAHEHAVTERGCQAACELAVDCGCVVWMRNLAR